MKKGTKTLMFRAILVMLLQLIACSNLKGEYFSIGDDGSITINNGRFTFTAPRDWVLMDDKNGIKMGPFITGFHADTSIDSTPSYFLVETSNMKVTKKQKKNIIENVQELQNVTDLKEHIEEKRYVRNPELYNPTYDLFIFVKAYPDGMLTVMLKTFDKKGALLFHYYLLGDLKKDIDAIHQLMKTLKRKE